MDIRSTNVKKNIKQTCDSILKHLESPPNKRQRLNNFPNKTYSDKISENTIADKLYKVISIEKEIDGESITLRLNRLDSKDEDDVRCSLKDSW